MDKYSKEILNILKRKYIEVAGERDFQNTSEAREYYLKDLEDNLYLPMSKGAFAAYGQGSGNEISSGKMNALRSSSAMTYNLFWDEVAEIPVGEDNGIGAGVYNVEFEKQYHTLRADVSNRPANLDAFLYCKLSKEAVACEMKMTEWLFNKPGELRDAYLNPDNYIDPEAGNVFVEVAKDLVLYNDYEDPETKKETYPGRLPRYDAFQMFKHAVACYTACVKEEPRAIKKLTLVNCVWTFQNPEQLSLKYQERYLKEEEAEREEFEQFKSEMEPVKTLFATKGIEFDIKFYTFKEFLKLFTKTEEELKYLVRYM